MQVSVRWYGLAIPALRIHNHAQAEDALRSAAYTYVVAALGSLATLIYYIMIFMGRRD